jgi:hypothetical protein
MAFDLPLPRQLAKAGWKVKIRDKERLEEPHLTIIKGTKAWRLGLRSGTFLLDDDRWQDFPDTLRRAIEDDWNRLCQEWDTMYPNNPVSSNKENDDEEDD